jgi:nucleoside-diphosphate-sugar epimerase
MKIFVTGASGFIGSHLTPMLAEHDVIPLTCDLLDFDSVRKQVQSTNPDIVLHLAARTEVEKSFYEQISFSQVNYVGSVNLIVAAKTCTNLKNFVFASTMEVYGWQPISDLIKHGESFDPVAFDEHTTPFPNAPYAVAKLAVEKYLEYMHRSQGFPFTAIRQTNAYGRQDNDFFVTEQIISQMLANPNKINLGYAQPYRNFIFVNDLLDAWLAIIHNWSLCNDGKIFTIGPDHPVQICDHANYIASQLDWHGEICWNTKPIRHGEIYWLNSNNKLLTDTLGWTPKWTYQQGIAQTIDIWKKNYANRHSEALEQRHA